MVLFGEQMSRIREVMKEEEGGENLFLPRLYTDEKWSANVAIENFQSVDNYYSHTMVFHSLTTASEESTEVEEKQWEWTVEVYPKVSY
jgi:hypothetical protein